MEHPDSNSHRRSHRRSSTSRQSSSTSSVSIGHVATRSRSRSRSLRCDRQDASENPEAEGKRERKEERGKRRNIQNREKNLQYETRSFTRSFGLVGNESEAMMIAPPTRNPRRAKMKSSDSPRGRGWDEKEENMKENQKQLKYAQPMPIPATATSAQEITIDNSKTVPPTTFKTRSSSCRPEPERERTSTESNENLLYAMPSDDFIRAQRSAFEQYVLTAQRDRVDQSWTESRESNPNNFDVREMVNDNDDDSDQEHDHLYYARLLAEENMANYQRQMQSTQSASQFTTPYTLQSSTTTRPSMVAPPTRHQTVRCRGPLNLRERTWNEGEYRPNNQRQVGYLQAELEPRETEENENEMWMRFPFNITQTTARNTTPRLPRHTEQFEYAGNTMQDVPNGDSIRDQHAFFTQSQNMMQRDLIENEFGVAASQYNPTNLHTTLKISASPNNENSNSRNDYVPFLGFSSLESNVNSQSQVNYLQPELTFSNPFVGEGNIMETFMEDPPTSSISYESTSPNYTTNEGTDAVWASNSLDISLLRLHYYMSPETFEHLRIHEPDFFASIQTSLPSRENETIFVVQSSNVFTPSLIGNNFSVGSFQDTTNNNEFGTTYSTTLPNFNVVFHPQREYTLAENISGRSQFTSSIPNNSTTAQYVEHTNVSLHANQSSAYFQIYDHRFPNIGLDLTTTSSLYGQPGQITSILEINNLTDNHHYSENNLESYLSTNQSNRRVSSDVTSISSSTSIQESSSLILSSSTSPGISFLSISQVFQPPVGDRSTVSSTNYNSTTNILGSEDSIEPMFPDIFFELRQGNHFLSPTTSDNDSWPFVPNVFHFHEEPPHPFNGLSKEQINNLMVRNFCENDALNACSICITEYIEGNIIRVLPCSHEFHVECIDRWLADNSTCPICRRQVNDTNVKENSR